VKTGYENRKLFFRRPLQGVFAPLVDQGEFERIFVDKETGTVCWPCSVDLDPAVLRSQITGEPLPGQAGKEAA